MCRHSTVGRILACACTAIIITEDIAPLTFVMVSAFGLTKVTYMLHIIHRKIKIVVPANNCLATIYNCVTISMQANQRM